MRPIPARPIPARPASACPASARPAAACAAAGLALLLAATSLAAQEAAPAAPTDPEGARLAERLPARVLRRMRMAPDRVLREAASLIYGHGRDGAIDARGIGRALALARADARGRALGQLLRADLDADGALTAEEAAALDGTAALRDRGRTQLALREADADGDGRASAAELAAQAERAARERVTDADAEAMEALLALDRGGDGRVDLDEVARALAAVAQPQAD